MGSDRTSWLATCIVAILAVAAGAQDFREGWETAQVTDYTPANDSFISADEGFWALNDSISQFPECGRTRNRAQILVENGSRVLRLLSNRSFTDCTDDIWVMPGRVRLFQSGLRRPADRRTRSSPSMNAGSWRTRNCTMEASTA